MPAQNAHNQQDQTKKAGKEHTVLLVAHDEAHNHGNGHGDDHNEQRPGRVVHGADAGQRKTGQGKNKNAQNRDTRHRTRDRPDFAGGDGRKALAFMTHGGKKNHHVMNRAAKHTPHQNPQGARQITKLGGQHRAYKRPGRGNGGKVVAVQNIFVGFHIVVPVGKAYRGRAAACIQPQNLVCQKDAVNTV